MRLRWNKKGSLIRVPEHQTFEFKTRYYDPEKEEAKQKRSQIKFNREESIRRQNDNLTGQFRRNHVVGYSRRHGAGQTQRTFLLTGMLIIILFYFFEQISLIFALPVLIILLLFFIHKSKRL